MAYATINKPSASSFSATQWAGNGGTQDVAVGFDPDFIWIKSYGGSTEHHLVSRVSGFGSGSSNTPNLSTNGTDGDYNRNIFTAAPSGGNLKLGDYSDTNANGTNHVGFCWKAGSTVATNNEGSINGVSVSASEATGVSIMRYTGNATDGATIGHGLAGAPEMLIGKKSSASGDDWFIYHKAIGAANTVRFGTGAAASNDSYDGADPTATTIALGNTGGMNTNGATHQIIAFQSIKGFSKVGSFIGNNNAIGAYVWCGFKPAWIMFKNSSTTNSNHDWIIMDNAQNTEATSNPFDAFVKANETAAQTTSGRNEVDFLSNGFRCRTSYGDINGGSNARHIFLAFAESPVVSTNGVPATAK